MPSCWPIVLHSSSRRRWRHGGRSRRPKRELTIFQDLRRGMRRRSKRRSLISNWTMNRRDRWANKTTCSRNRDMTKRRKFRTPSCSKRKRRLSNPRWSSSRTSRSRDRTNLEWSRKIRWRIRSVFNPSDLPWWKSRRKKEERPCKLDVSMKRDAPKKKLLETLRWTRSLRWRSLKWSSLRDSRILRPSRRSLT